MRGENRRLRAVLNRVDRLSVPKAIEDEFSKYRDDPVRFAVDVLGVTSGTRRSDGTEYQFEVLRDLAEHDRVVVRSGHGVGKSAVDAWAIIWFLLTRPYSKALVLAPEFSRQIVAVLFAEVRRWVRQSETLLPLKVLTNRVQVGDFGAEWGAMGASTAGDEARLQGFHASGGLLLVLDETKGIPQSAFDAVQGALTGDEAKLLVTSVPGGAGSGPLWKACEHAGDRWRVHHLSSEDSSLVRPEWVEDMAKQWGTDSPLYQMRVRGEFSDEGEGVLFPITLLESVTRADVAGDGDLVLGVEVARSVAGDKNCIAICRGGRLQRLILWRSPNTMEAVTRVLNEAVNLRPKSIHVDVGGVGAGVVDRLRQTRVASAVIEVAFGGKAKDTQRFKNKRAEMFWTLREGMEQGKVTLPEDDELVADLTALRYEFAQDGRIILESKDDCRKRLGRSPDRADALALAIGAGGRPAAVIDARLCGISQVNPWTDGYDGRPTMADYARESARRLGGR